MRSYLSLIKFSHTIFALPFALLGYFFALQGEPIEWKTLGLVLLCMIFARSAAMAFNRWADRKIDAKNPRTAVREIPAGIVSENAALIFIFMNCGLFILTTFFINPICFYLSPIALLVVLGYSYTKRFTWLCHLVLGLGLGLAPVGAWLAVTGSFSLLPVILGLAVLFWVAGFDIIYALQDEEFDKSNALYSIPTFLGKKNALRFSTLLHFFCAGLMLFATYQMLEIYPNLGTLAYIAAGIFLSLLLYQHTIVKPDDLSRVNMAFFTTNGIASLLFGSLLILDLFV